MPNIKINNLTPEKFEVPKPTGIAEYVRHYFDEENQNWYFSIVDVIEILTDTSDARNYWKVLKNRLKKTDFELVTECNQLKMKAKDGKYYLTDVANPEILARIIESIPSAKMDEFKLLIREIIKQKKEEKAPVATSLKEREFRFPSKKEITEIATKNENDAELPVDAFETKTKIFIKSFIAGVEPENVNISVGERKIIIHGKREKTSPELSDHDSRKYLYEEIFWTTFSKTIILPSPIDKKEIRVDIEDGVLTIEMSKL